MAISRQPSRHVLVLQNSGAEVSTAQNLSPFYQWVINGELTFPQVESQDALHQIDASFLIHQVRVSAKTAGTSTYNIQILSHDVSGGNEVVLVNEAIIFSADKSIFLLPVLDSNIPQNSTIEMTIFEQTVGTPAKDVTVSLIGQPFSAVTPILNGHKLQDNADAIYSQREKVKFDNHFALSDDLANDRSLVDLIGSEVFSTIKQSILDATLPIGEYKTANLTEVQFQAQMGTGWVLADGRSVVGSSYESITGDSNIPDARGMVFRGKNEGRSDGKQNPDGEILLGVYQADAVQQHTHTYNTVDFGGGSEGAGTGHETATSSSGVVGANVSTETRMRNISVNNFIRIN